MGSLESFDLLIDAPFPVVECLQSAGMVVNNAHRACESKSDSTLRDGDRIFGIANTATDDRIDIDRELRVRREKLEFLVEHLEALHRHVIGLDVVYADLQVVQSGIVEISDFLRCQQVPIRDDPGNHAVVPDAVKDSFDFGMKQGFAPAQRHGRGTQSGKEIYPAEHGLDRYRRRKIVVFVAITARQVTASSGDDVGEQRVLCRHQPAQHHLELAQFQLESLGLLHCQAEKIPYMTGSTSGTYSHIGTTHGIRGQAPNPTRNSDLGFEVPDPEFH